MMDRYAGPCNGGQAIKLDVGPCTAGGLLNRKLHKSAKMVYNRLEIKNGITKERRCDFAMTLFMQFFVFGLGCTI